MGIVPLSLNLESSPLATGRILKPLREGYDIVYVLPRSRVWVREVDACETWNFEFKEKVRRASSMGGYHTNSYMGVWRRRQTQD